MIEHNYYQLLELEPFSTIDIVRKRYRQLAMKYHPDRNPGNNSVEEFFKIITQGYNILSDPELKTEYDMALRSFLSGQGASEGRKYKPSQNFINKTEEIRQRILQHKEGKRRSVIADFERRENLLSHHKREWIGYLLFLLGVLIAYNHWFINYLDFNVNYIVAGSFFFITGAYFIADNRYRLKVYKMAISNQLDLTKVVAPIRTFALLFVLTPLVFIVFTYLSKIVQLHCFYNYTRIETLTPHPEGYNYKYKVNGVEILRVTSQEPNVRIKDRLRVKYSIINPVISEVVMLDEIENQLKESVK